MSRCHSNEDRRLNPGSGAPACALAPSCEVPTAGSTSLKSPEQIKWPTLGEAVAGTTALIFILAFAYDYCFLFGFGFYDRHVLTIGLQDYVLTSTVFLPIVILYYLVQWLGIPSVIEHSLPDRLMHLPVFRVQLSHKILGWTFLLFAALYFVLYYAFGRIANGVLIISIGFLFWLISRSAMYRGLFNKSYYEYILHLLTVVTFISVVGYYQGMAAYAVPKLSVIQFVNGDEISIASVVRSYSNGYLYMDLSNEKISYSQSSQILSIDNRITADRWSGHYCKDRSTLFFCSFQVGPWLEVVRDRD